MSSASAGMWPDRLEPRDFPSLRFSDFPGGTIVDIADHLFRIEPNFMRALEADVREDGVSEPVELGRGDTIMDGHHRMAAAYRVGVGVPVAFYGERYPVDRAQQAWWDDLRRSDLEEYWNRVCHMPWRWRHSRLPGTLQERPAEAAAAEHVDEAELEAG